VFGFPDHGSVMTAQAKTFNISEIGITTNSGEPVARVTDQIATITQMTNPSTGAPWVIVSLTTRSPPVTIARETPQVRPSPAQRATNMHDWNMQGYQ